jgi:hypothetical protein
MKRHCGLVSAALVALVGCGSLTINSPADVAVGTSPPPRVNCGPTPRTYDEAVAAWRQTCERNAYLEQRNTRLEEKYQKERRERKEAESKYDRLKDKYDD